MKAGAHGPDQLYDKFFVAKTKHVERSGTGHWVVPPDKRLDDEFVFVLRPETDDFAAFMALHTYIRFCSRTYPHLAEGIAEQLEALEPRYEKQLRNLRNGKE